MMFIPAIVIFILGAVVGALFMHVANAKTLNDYLNTHDWQIQERPVTGMGETILSGSWRKEWKQREAWALEDKIKARYPHTTRNEADR